MRTRDFTFTVYYTSRLSTFFYIQPSNVKLFQFSDSTTSDTASGRSQTLIRSGRGLRTSIMARLYTADEILRMGLEQIGFSDDKQERVGRPTNVRRFKAHYGSSPLVVATIWEDLLTTDIPAARIPSKTSPDKLFLGMYFLKVYPTEEQLAGRFSKCERGARKWAWLFASKIQALKAQKVRIYASSN